eukprot:g20995.t1
MNRVIETLWSNSSMPTRYPKLIGLEEYGPGAGRDRKTVYHGDENPLTLIFDARNLGEGGAYEAELYVFVPSEAEYSGIVRNE